MQCVQVQDKLYIYTYIVSIFYRKMGMGAAMKVGPVTCTNVYVETGMPI